MPRQQTTRAQSSTSTTSTSRGFLVKTLADHLSCTTALHAIHGASRAARLWDQRIAKYGAVPDAMDNPLHQDNLHPYSMDDAFGKGLFT